MLSTEETEIEGVLFRVTQLPFAQARPLFVRLIGIAGPALVSIASKKASVRDLDLTEIAQRVIEKCPDRELAEISAILAECTTYSLDGGSKWPTMLFKGAGGHVQDNRGDVFDGRLMLFFEWLVFAIRVQFADFSKALGKSPAASARS
jgi:hypothetical protein